MVIIDLSLQLAIGASLTHQQGKLFALELVESAKGHPAHQVGKRQNQQAGLQHPRVHRFPQPGNEQEAEVEVGIPEQDSAQPVRNEKVNRQAGGHQREDRKASMAGMQQDRQEQAVQRDEVDEIE